MKDVLILAIESSCDETSVAIVKNGCECLEMVTNTQIKTHELYGGVVPEIASRMHAEVITLILDELWKKVDVTMDDVDAVAVTYAPGLMGSLLVGVEAAKALALAFNKPLIAVNHMAGHIYANNLEQKMEYPLLALVVSGGHTDLLLMNGDYDFKKLGSTLDDAIGECYDKVARVLGLKYPGGPNIEKMAREGNFTYNLPVAMNDDSFNFSFSGLKSNIINLVHNEKQRGNEIRKADLAYSFQKVAVDQLKRKVEKAFNNYSVKSFILAGGVSANNYLRQEMTDLAEKYNIKFNVPKFVYCTDNAAMIGAAAYPLFLQQRFADYDLNAQSYDEIY